MLNFRQFESPPDLSGRTWQVYFKWMQTAISLRHSDSVDTRFLLESGGERIEKTIAMAHPDLLELARTQRRELTDPWCSRLAALHLRYMLATGADMEKDIATASAAQLAGYAAEIDRAEQQEIQRRTGAART